ALLLMGQPRLLELFAHHRKGLRWDRQVERVIAGGAPLGVQFVQHLRQSAERRLAVKGPPPEPEPHRPPCSKGPCPNRVPPPSRAPAFCRNGVGACCLTASRTSFAESSWAQS